MLHELRFESLEPIYPLTRKGKTFEVGTSQNHRLWSSNISLIIVWDGHIFSEKKGVASV